MLFFSLKIACLRLPVDSRVKQYVFQQVEDGIISSAEVRRHTQAFVRRSLFNGKELPSLLNRRYFPTRRDYVNLIYSARTAQMKSSVDQINIESKIDEWKKANEHQFLFRSFIEDTSMPDVVSDSENVLVHSKGRLGLLIVHQTRWQKRLMARYGHMVLLDATYKTTTYAVPLFFVDIKWRVAERALYIND